VAFRYGTDLTNWTNLKFHISCREFTVQMPFAASIPRNTCASTHKWSRICGEDNEAVDLIDQVTQGKTGVNNRNTQTRPVGTTRQRALRQLRKSRPDLHAKVLKGKLSPHAAMIEAKEARPWKAAPLRFSYWIMR